MEMRLLRVVALGSVLSTGLASAPILASCERDFRPLAEQFQASESVFLGQVISIVAKDESGTSTSDGCIGYDHHEMTLRTTKAWTPGVDRKMVVQTPGGASGKYPFQVGHMYLIFANKRPSDGVLEVDVCTPTRADDDAGRVAATLDKTVKSYIPK